MISWVKQDGASAELQEFHYFSHTNTRLLVNSNHHKSITVYVVTNEDENVHTNPTITFVIHEPTSLFVPKKNKIRN